MSVSRKRTDRYGFVRRKDGPGRRPADDRLGDAKRAFAALHKDEREAFQSWLRGLYPAWFKREE